MTQHIVRFFRLGVMSCCALLAQGAAANETIKLPPETVRLKPATLAGYSIAQQKCGICHSADYILYQPPGMTLVQWTAEMQKMQHGYGAPIDAGEIKLLAIYLAATYGDAASVTASDRQLTLSQIATQEHTQAAPAGSNGPGAAGADAQTLLASNGCLGCHGLKQKIVGPAYHDIAAKYRADPNAATKVATNIQAGGAGKWGPVPMPPFPGLSHEQSLALAKFVLLQ
jgi:cytochrome c551/c552